MKRTNLTKLFALLLGWGASLSAWAQQPVISPLPQKATWGAEAFPNMDYVTFRMVGAKQADQDAVSVLEEALNLQDKGQITLTIGEVGDKAIKKYQKNVPTQAEGYYLKVTPKEVVIAGRDERGTYYGVQTFLKIAEQAQVMQVEMSDWPSVACRGVIEGYYGNPWSHSDRISQFKFYGENKMNIYVYGPKDDPYHRAHWREPYPAEEAARIKELVYEANRHKVQFVWAIHPGGDIQWNKADSVAICLKLEKMYDLGVRTFAVFFDDIWGEGARGEKQAGLLNYITDQFVRKHKDVEPLIMCPTQYNKAWSGGDYLTTLGTQMYPEVRIMWTGNSVVDMIEQNDMEWINAQIKRKAFIWLNYPVNDYCQSRLLMGKTYGNGLNIADMVSGFCSNPMEYAEASKVSLYSIADYTWNMPQYRSTESWERAIRALMPTSAEAFKYFCENNVDLGKTGHGLRREGESPQFRQHSDHKADFMALSTYADALLADSVNAPDMLREIKPWVESMQLLGQRGLQVIAMQQALQQKDSLAFIAHYRTQRSIDQAQKAITSRNFEGSIVKAKPVVSGDVITPWVNEEVDRLIKTYKQQHNFCLEVFPVQSIADGEYFIKVNGEYLTDAQASADRVGDHPIFMAERDNINPQRQQWLIELDPKTGRYKISNKQDGRYLNERGTFWNNKELNPYDAQWHTYILTQQEGKWSIQCAGNAGKAFWNRQGNRLNSSNTELFIFEIVKP